MAGLMCKRQPWQDLPVIGICGSNRVGKTTLIEGLIPKLSGRGLKVVVVKDGAGQAENDGSEKDSYRFFQAGADVATPDEEYFIRCHESESFFYFLRRLCRDYDLVLVEGHARTPVPKIWLLGRGQMVPPANVETILYTLRAEEREVDAVFDWIFSRLEQQCRRLPVYGCLLIGGRSRRMGQPKHLLLDAGSTWAERTVVKLEPHVQEVVLSGKGKVPASLAHLTRLPDVPGLAGPMAGILAVLRWQPLASWIVTACDLPDIDPLVFVWLKEQRRLGVRAIFPDLKGDGHLEPLLAWYNFNCRPSLEEFAKKGCLSPRCLADKVGVLRPQPPSDLRRSWRNVNTPAELARTTSSCG